MERYTFDSSCIDLVSERVESFLNQEKVISKDILRTKLMVEEALLNYRERLGEDASFSLACIKRFGRIRIELIVAGDSLDPFSPDASVDNDILRGVLSGAGIIPTWQYKNGQNILIFSPKKKKPSQMVWLIGAVLLALLSGLIFQFLPAGWGAAVSEQIVSPVFDTFIGFLTALVGFVIFLSLVWGIVSIGDLSTFEKIGKIMMLRVVVMCGALMVAYGLLILPLFPVTLKGAASMQLSSLFGMFLDIIPNNFVAPFLEGNPLQIVFIAMIVGIALLTLGVKTSLVSSLIEQLNSVINLIMEGVGGCVPFLVFASLFNMIVGGSFQAVLEAYKMVLLVIGGILFAMLVYFLLCLRTKVRPSVLLKKLLPTFLIAFMTASSAAALPINLETCTKQFGIDKTVTRFGVPLYQVIFMPITAIEFFTILLCAAEIYGIAISPTMLVMAVITILLLSIATPPIPGSGAAILIILFSQFGIPAEMIAVASSVDILLEFLITAGEIFCQQCELVQLSFSLDKIDLNTLRSETGSKGENQ